MNKPNGTRIMLEEAEIELRNAIMAERAGIKNATQRRQRAELNVERWRQRALVADATMRRHFGPGEGT